VPVGELGRPHGLDGQLHLWPHHAPAPSLTTGRPVLLERDDAWLAATVAAAAPHGRGMLIAFDGVRDRTAAESLTGMRVLVRAQDLPALAADEFYHYELEGFAVVTTDGRRLGAIASTFATGTSDVWVVRDERREYLVPVIADVVRTIDRSARRVVIEPLPGLLG